MRSVSPRSSYPSTSYKQPFSVWRKYQLQFDCWQIELIAQTEGHIDTWTHGNAAHLKSYPLIKHRAFVLSRVDVNRHNARLRHALRVCILHHLVLRNCTPHLKSVSDGEESAPVSSSERAPAFGRECFDVRQTGWLYLTCNSRQANASKIGVQ